MKIGIIGLPQVGKKAFFELLTGNKSQADFGKQEIKIGAALIRDSRFDYLVSMYQPLKQVPATIDVVLLPKFDEETVKSGEFLKSLEKCDALCHIVRAFKDEAVFHSEGSVDPLRDIDKILTELVLSDLILVEKRIERIDNEKKKGASSSLQDKEREIIVRMKQTLDENKPLINFTLNDEEKKLMSTYQFLTRKPMIIVLNINDDKIIDSSLVKNVEEKYKDFQFKVMQTSAKIEAELSLLEQTERQAFLDDLNIKEPALNKLSALCFEALGLISFFTVGKDEVRQWTVKKASSAPQAAGAIHSDLERGFIRAEVMKYGELYSFGSELKLKENGKIYLKGKDYIVEDGDIINIRFNV
ncbi:MAG: redox-regulated ATPase YchF [Candidatus Omnitrophica bacterium]|nr:redox-regulated ATPase YchF [Candidatus Omnitrophota bacterium]